MKAGLAKVLTRLGRLPVLAVYAVGSAGLLYVAIAPAHWLRGVLLVAGAMLIGGVVRVVLPPEQIPQLVVRSRWFDCLCFFGTGVVIIALGLSLRSTERVRSASAVQVHAPAAAPATTHDGSADALAGLRAGW